MTVTSFLAAHGIQRARYVTADGRTIFDNVTASGSVYTHPTHGTVTKVANHTFHDGHEPTDASADSWWTDETSLRRHIDAVSEAFPAFDFIAPEGESAPAWVGELNTGRGAFRVGLVLRRDNGLPFVAVLGNRRLGKPAGRHFIRSPHLYDSGNPCIADQADWRPDEHTAATAIAWLAHWLAAYTEWRITDRWPVAGVHCAA